MKRKIVILLLPLILWACSDEVPMVNLGIDDVYYVARMQKLPLHSALTGEKYRWTVNGKEVSATDSYIFLAEARVSTILRSTSSTLTRLIILSLR